MEVGSVLLSVLGFKVKDAGSVCRSEWILATRQKSFEVLVWVAKLPESRQQASSRAGSHLILLMELFRVIAVRHSGHCGHSAHAVVAELDLRPADGGVDGLVLRRCGQSSDSGFPSSGFSVLQVLVNTHTHTQTLIASWPSQLILLENPTFFSLIKTLKYYFLSSW